ncbi:MAG: crotonase/enoyl-CoA hydratase family protein [Gammaproteobacteria bacterium]|uniref:crotonase/enoyl-CoA hydratase family protein n=1 Tax=Nevskia sp. TaxID=1929292 RepID=UPI003F6E7F19|nr:crotonase/enoyl-CoA hydratase family protein [Gammaproteobacteria bacterium]
MTQTPAAAPKILTERRGHVLLITFNRPEKYNAFDLEMHHQLAAAYGLLDTDPELRCALVSANGKAFTAGLELTQWTPAFASGQWPDLAEHERDPFGLIPEKRVSKPVIFAMHGICFTVAIELALAADIRVAADDCRFGQIEVKRGIYAVGGATVRMVQEFGWGNAQKYLLTGDEFNAAEALRIGLVQEVVPAGQQFERGLAIAERVAAQAPLGVYASLKSSRIAIEQGDQVAIERLVRDLSPIMGSDDVKEGVASFVERRPARFTGR